MTRSLYPKKPSLANCRLPIEIDRDDQRGRSAKESPGKYWGTAQPLGFALASAQLFCSRGLFFVVTAPELRQLGEGRVCRPIKLVRRRQTTACDRRTTGCVRSTTSRFGRKSGSDFHWRANTRGRGRGRDARGCDA